MMLIPYHNAKGFVQACQIRFMCRTASPGVRYVWLSTPDKTNGAGCGSPLHFASYDYASLNTPILITEGALKAETVRVYKTRCNVLANAGITCSHEKIVAA